MFTSSNHTSRLAGFMFAVVMTVTVNSGVLMTFDSVATYTTLAQTTPTRMVAVLETVTIVGRRI